MYLVKVEIRESEINGKGVFSLEEISKGTVVWKFNQNHEVAISVVEFDALDSKIKTELEKVAYLSPTTGRYVYPPDTDPGRFTNHSENNNLSAVINREVSDEPYFIANKDIQAGEEMTNNYIEFDEVLKTKCPDWM